MPRKALLFIMLFYNCTSFADPLLIEPLSNVPMPSSLIKGETVRAYYLVKNISNYDSYKNQLHFDQENVRQVINETSTKLWLCGESFDLAVDGSCVLGLEITGSVDSNDTNMSRHLSICQNNNSCSRITDNKNELNIEEGNHNILNRVLIIGGSTGINAYKSVDDGLTWMSSSIDDSDIGLPGRIGGVICSGVNNQYCTAVGQVFKTNSVQFNKVYTSSNGGMSWKGHTLDVSNKGGAGISSVSCDKKYGSHCVAVGGIDSNDKPEPKKPIIYVSNNYGDSWSSIYPENRKNGVFMRSVSCTGDGANNCLAIGDHVDGYEDNNNITEFLSYTSSDGGMRWTLHQIDRVRGLSTLNSISCMGDDGMICLAVGSRYIKIGNVDKQRAVIYKTIDSGEHWSVYDPSEIYMAQSTSLNKVTCNSVGNCVVAGNKGIMSSSDKGVEWKSGFVNYMMNYEDVYCNGDKNQYCTAISPGHKTIAIATSTSTEPNRVWQARSPYNLKYDASLNAAVGGG